MLFPDELMKQVREAYTEGYWDDNTGGESGGFAAMRAILVPYLAEQDREMTELVKRLMRMREALETILSAFDQAEARETRLAEIVEAWRTAL